LREFFNIIVYCMSTLSLCTYRVYQLCDCKPR